MNKITIPTSRQVNDAIENTVVRHYPLMDISYDKRNPKVLRIMVFPNLRLVIEKINYILLKRRLKKKSNFLRKEM